MVDFGFGNEGLFAAGQGLVANDRMLQAKRSAAKKRKQAREAVARKAKNNPGRGFDLPVYGKR